MSSQVEPHGLALSAGIGFLSTAGSVRFVKGVYAVILRVQENSQLYALLESGTLPLILVHKRMKRPTAFDL